ncbi:DUF6122 family protein [Flagellimonas meridianipacifica]|uniref:LexA-binding, inner membrane-associated hydrolase n=1 Tax=Flagellimonas meridianipacifica TaxID=1080225 RepID=A0A2T0M9W1_9FLAO|nr:DUF6122 family protein [Allomuricauda pacifica]PRX54212.1 hypothetical protein CLV81_2609 [Allomuricauda pacifica]
MLRFIIHYGIHFLIPILIGYGLFKEDKLKITLILLSGIFIDLDHLLATPIFDANRCSIGFHPLHSSWAILVYAILPFFPKTRILGLALLIHIIADTADCLWIGFPS